jgi:hypothetical protein
VSGQIKLRTNAGKLDVTIDKTTLRHMGMPYCYIDMQKLNLKRRKPTK